MDKSDGTKNINEPTKQKPTIDSISNASLKRRTLVKGSAAVLPAIFTLRSGAVFANTSATQGQCSNPPIPPDLAVISPDADQWCRVEVECRLLQILTNDPFRVYQNPDTNLWFDAGNTEWINATPVDPPPLDPPVGENMRPANGITNAEILEVERCFVLVLFDENGVQTDLAVSSDGTGNPLTISCLVSSDPNMALTHL